MMSNICMRLMMAAAATAILSLPRAAVAQPPATQPPPAQPPVTQQPPATQPPATQPPATQPPAQQPPAVPPATPDPNTPPPAAQPPATPPAATPQESAQTPNQTRASGGAAVLLDRISEIVDAALSGKTATKTSANGTPGAKGTSGVLKVGKTSAGKVSVDRSALDEIQAEVEQLKIMLTDSKKQP
jgi:hypothetical protein